MVGSPALKDQRAGDAACPGGEATDREQHNNDPDNRHDTTKPDRNCDKGTAKEESAALGVGAALSVNDTSGDEAAERPTRNRRAVRLRAAAHVDKERILGHVHHPCSEQADAC